MGINSKPFTKLHGDDSVGYSRAVGSTDAKRYGLKIMRLDQQTGIEQVASDLPEDQLVQFGCVDRGRATGRVVRAIVPARGAPVVDPPPPLAALGGDARMLAATHPAAEQSTQEPPLLLEPSRAELAVGFPPGA